MNEAGADAELRQDDRCVFACLREWNDQILHAHLQHVGQELLVEKRPAIFPHNQVSGWARAIPMLCAPEKRIDCDHSASVAVLSEQIGHEDCRAALPHTDVEHDGGTRPGNDVDEGLVRAVPALQIERKQRAIASEDVPAVDGLHQFSSFGGHRFSGSAWILTTYIAACLEYANRGAHGARTVRHAPSSAGTTAKG